MTLEATLGLQPIGALWNGSQEWTPLGTVTLYRATVDVEVSQMPARFWRFTITPKDVPEGEDAQAVTLSTGSGDLSAYWPTVELFADGMMHAEVS